MAFKLVSCDGGGIRGYLTCLILQSLQEETRFLDRADGFAGTSTGGLIAVSLADGRSQGKDMSSLLDDLLTVYRDDAEMIFRENDRTLAGKVFDQILKRCGWSGGPGITAAQFSADGLLETGERLVGDRTIGSISKDLVLAVTTVCLHLSERVGWAPFTLTNHNTGTGPWLDMHTVKLVDIAMATSAAPTYFPPHRITAGGVDYGYFADGGMFANNPVLNGINVAIAAKRAESLEDIEAVSIGTGQQPIEVSESTFKRPEDWGMLKWFGVTSDMPTGALLDLGLTTSAENQYWIAHLVLKERLARLNPPLSKVVGLATVEPESFTLMEEAFQTCKESAQWAHTVTMLKNW
ncbi:patatin-like phospholipase family protein [Ruegeria sp. 2012CJ41-6]|uniref:Patatin-like phospholipase family protein n=1 Tax=Ruegeria spongiae TaxID=2942209 RepID=A0ABT0Q2Y6_9RHOB|nr:patatin-like phospholipase family protein [Ruegeria spongiae]MCL6284234.1 patatin-like phospholipase family protein [Ruegeria spongiae]